MPFERLNTFFIIACFIFLGWAYAQPVAYHGENAWSDGRTCVINMAVNQTEFEELIAFCRSSYLTPPN